MGAGPSGAPVRGSRAASKITRDCRTLRRSGRGGHGFAPFDERFEIVEHDGAVPGLIAGNVGAVATGFGAVSALHHGRRDRHVVARSRPRVVLVQRIDHERYQASAASKPQWDRRIARRSGRAERREREQRRAGGVEQEPRICGKLGGTEEYRRLVRRHDLGQHRPCRSKGRIETPVWLGRHIRRPVPLGTRRPMNLQSVRGKQDRCRDRVHTKARCDCRGCWNSPLWMRHQARRTAGLDSHCRSCGTRPGPATPRIPAGPNRSSRPENRSGSRPWTRSRAARQPAWRRSAARRARQG